MYTHKKIHRYKTNTIVYYQIIYTNTNSITSVLKSGDASQVINYRPISIILSHMADLFESIVLSKIQKIINPIFMEEQNSFRPGSSIITINV